jgi:hypothetical protein
LHCDARITPIGGTLLRSALPVFSFAARSKRWYGGLSDRP